MPTTLSPVDDAFLATAPFTLTGTIELPHSPEQVWAALASDQMGSWMAVLDRAHWVSPRPVQAGSRRTARLFRLITLHENFYRWDDATRATFRVETISAPLVRGWVEDFRLEPLADGGTRLGWTMAIDNLLLRILRRPLRAGQPHLDRLAPSFMRGITTILPDPTPGVPDRARPETPPR